MRALTIIATTLFMFIFSYSQDLDIHTNEATTYAGKTKNVFGWVDSVKTTKTQTIIFLSSGGFSSPDQTLLIKIFAKDYKKFKRPFADYTGQPVNVTGLIKIIEKTPQIIVTTEENLILQSPPPMEIVH